MMFYQVGLFFRRCESEQALHKALEEDQFIGKLQGSKEEFLTEYWRKLPRGYSGKGTFLNRKFRYAPIFNNYFDIQK